MTNESTFSDLRAAISRLEAEKRQIEERHRALVTTLRYFENAESSEGRPEQEPTITISIGAPITTCAMRWRPYSRPKVRSTGV